MNRFLTIVTFIFLFLTMQCAQNNTQNQSSATGAFTAEATPQSTSQNMKAWNVTSAAQQETSLYNTVSYFMVSQNLNKLQNYMTDIMQFYNNQKLIHQTSWSNTRKNSIREVKEYQEYFSKYLQFMVGKQTSYLHNIGQIFNEYKKLPGIYELKLEQLKEEKQFKKEVILDFKKLPFQSGSFALELVEEATGSVLNYIRNRMELITGDTYDSELTQIFLVGSPATPSQFAQLQRAVDMLERMCETNFEQLKQTRGISKQEFDVLENNYKSIFNSYEEASSKFLIAFTLKLLQQVSTQYPFDLSIHADVTTMDASLPVLKELYEYSKPGLEVLERVAKQKDKQQHTDSRKKQLYFGLYDSPKAVLHELAGLMAGLLCYAGTVKQNLVSQQIKNQEQDLNIPLMQKNLSTCSLLYMQAAGCYYDAGKMTSYSAYGTIGKAFSMVAQSWIKAQKNDRPGTYGYAADQYQLSYEAAQETGDSNLSFLLLRFYNMAMLNYAQYSLSQYAHLGEYQKDVSNYIENAATIPQNKQDSRESLIQNLFYSHGSTAFKGIGTLCSQVAESYKANLSSLQATKSSMNSNKKLLLQNGITVTQNISDAAQAMIFPGRKNVPMQLSSADWNIYVTYSNPEAVFYGQQRYFDVFHSFQLADNALQQAPNNRYAPLQALFKDSPVKTFVGLAQLHFARICLMSALEARSYVTNPKYAYYKNNCIVSSFLSYLSAYKVYRSLGHYSQLVEYCDHQLKQFNSVIPVILQDAQKRVQNSKVTEFDYQMALTETQGAAFLGNEQATQLYEQILQQYLKKAGDRTFNTQFPAALQAYACYKAYLLSVYQHNQENTQKYEGMIRQALQDLMGQINDATNFITNEDKTFDERIEMQTQLQDLQKSLEQYSIAQYYDQALFGIENNDFCKVQKIESREGSAISQIEIVFIGNIKKVLLNPLYQLAQLYTAQSKTDIESLERNFYGRSPDYGLLTTPRFKKIMKNYQTALMGFGQLGLQNQVMNVEQLMTQAAAFRYFSAVIPSNIVKNITLSTIATVDTGTQSFQGQTNTSASGAWHTTSNNNDTSDSASVGAWHTTSNNSQESNSGNEQARQGGSGQQQEQKQGQLIKKPTLLPYYLVAGWEVNITKLATDASNLADQASQQTADGTSIPPAMVQKQKLYNQLLGTAQKLMGKKESIEAIIKYVVVPLFYDQLQTGGYQGVFRTVKQEVELYHEQVNYLVNHGMQIGSGILKATVKIKTTANPITGKKDVILEGTNLPLAPIPRYRGDTNCAVFYYSLYKKFFNQTGQPVDVGDQVFFPITGSEALASGKRGQRETDRAYLASALQYKHKIAYLVEPLKAMSEQQRFDADFQKYKPMYSQLEKAYEWQIALVSAIDMLQEKAGLGYVNVNKKNEELYQSWAEDAQLFLFGAPFAPAYIQVLNNIQGYYDLAAKASQSPSHKSFLYKQAGQLNIKAAEKCETIEQIVPQIDGYPATQPSGYPSDAAPAEKGIKKLKCTAPPRYSMPFNQPVAWKHYEDAQIHYQEALKLYKQAFAVEKGSDTTISNSMIRFLTGRSFMCYARASLQRLALFGRNAWTVTVQDVSHVQGETVYINEKFKKIKADGASGGALSAVSGEQSLVSGSGQQSSGNAVAQYQLMKKVMLDALIYAMPLGTTAKSLLQDLPSISTAQKNAPNSIAGKSIICAALNNAPNLGFRLLTDKGAPKAGDPSVNAIGYASKGSIAEASNMMDLLPALSKISLLYGDTFPSFVEYTLNDLMGTNNFEGLNNNLQVAALTTFVTQYYFLLSNFYKQTFFYKEMQHMSSDADIQKVDTSFNTAIKAAQQKMLVNATGYLG